MYLAEIFIKLVIAIIPPSIIIILNTLEGRWGFGDQGREDVFSLFSISKPLSAWVVPLGVLVTEGSGSWQTPEIAPVLAMSTNSTIPMTVFLIIRKALLCHFLLVLSVSRGSEESWRNRKESGGST